MSDRRYDPEWALAAVMATYLGDTEILDAQLFAGSPVVTFFDLMAQDEANRVVVLVHDVDSPTDGEANFDAVVEVTVKSQLRQPTLEADMAAHWLRTRAVRAALCDAGLLAALDAVDEGLGVDYVNKARQMKTLVVEGWIYSETRLGVKAHARQPA